MLHNALANVHCIDVTSSWFLVKRSAVSVVELNEYCFS